MKLRVGVVGLGKAWETRHGPALRALSDRYDLRAVCEPVAHRAEQVAREFKATAGDGRVSLSWNLPSTTGGVMLIGFHTLRVAVYGRMGVCRC